MSISTKIILDMSSILSNEIKKYEDLIRVEVSKTLDRINIEEMIEQVTFSLISQDINRRMNILLRDHPKISELLTKKIKESIEGVDLMDSIKKCTKDILEDAIEKRYREDY